MQDEMVASAAPLPPHRRLAGIKWALCAGILVALSACSTGRDGRYLGTLSTQNGTCGLSATANGQLDGVLMIRGDEAVFAPEEGVVVLRGRIDPAGHVVTASAPIGADRKPFTMVFEGDLHGDKVTGRYATPRCRASVALTRAG
jgi:hypothetical protein